MTVERTNRFLGWLRHGAELAIKRRGEKANRTDVIWSLIEEAVETIDRHPDQERIWLGSGRRCVLASMVVVTKTDLSDLERLRYLSAMKPYDGPASTVPDPDAIERSLDVLEWLQWSDDEDPIRMQKAAIALARHGDHEVFYRVWCRKKPRHRNTLSDFKQRCAGWIITGLRRDYGIVPAGGVEFTEVFNVASA